MRNSGLSGGADRLVLHWVALFRPEQDEMERGPQSPGCQRERERSQAHISKSHACKVQEKDRGERKRGCSPLPCPIEINKNNS